jgi:hypothetical protein
MHKQHTIEIPVAIRNLGADMLGDEQAGKLPPSFALELMLRMMRLDVTGVVEMHGDVCRAGWDNVLHNDLEQVERLKLADSYCRAARDILSRV